MIAWLRQTCILYGTCLKNYLNVKLLDKILNHIALNVIELNWQGINNIHTHKLSALYKR